MNRTIIVCTLSAMFFSCKKTEISPDLFGKTPITTVFVGATPISVLPYELKIQLQFIVMDTVVDNSETDVGNLDKSEYNATVPTSANYNYAVSNFQINKNQSLNNTYSTIVLIDQTSEPSPRFDKCLTYWVKNLRNENEIAILGYSDNYESGYKIYGDGFINQNSTDKFAGIFDAFEAPRIGNPNPISAANNSIDYLLENAKNDNLNILILSSNTTTEDEIMFSNLISKAIANNVKISTRGPSNDWEFVRLAYQTGGMFTREEVRTLTYSMNPILSGKYNTSTCDLTITKLSGTAFASPGIFGSYISIYSKQTEDLSTLYYYVNY